MKNNYSILKQFSTCVLLSIIISLGTIEAQPPQNSTLMMIQELFRHGARQNIYPKYDGAQYFNDIGELTPVGIRQHFTLGQLLRKVYMYENQLIPTVYNHSLIYIRSTDVNRTIMSAYSQLYGIFPEGLGPNLPSGLNQQYLLPPFQNSSNYAIPDGPAIPNNIQAIPVHTVLQNKDLMLRAYGTGPCQNQDKWQSENAKSTQLDHIQSIFNESIAQFVKLNPVLNVTTQNVTISQIADTVDVYTCDLYANRQVPSEYLNDAQYQSDLDLLFSIDLYYNLFNQPVQARVAGSQFHLELVKNFNNTILNNITEKWMIYSAHDSTVASMLRFLNFTSWECIVDYQTGANNGTNCIYNFPGFASNIIYELWTLPIDSDDKIFIYIQYNGEYIDTNCNRKDKGCDWNVWQKQVLDYAYPDANVECGNYAAVDNSDEDQKLPYWGLITIISLASLIITLVITIILIFRKFAKERRIKTNDSSFQDEQLDI